MPVGSPAASVSTTPPGTASSSATASAAELTHSEWPSWARSATLTPGATASSAWRVGFSLPQLVAPATAAQPAARRQLGGGDALERLGQRAAAEQPQLAARERPAREVHVRVDEARHDAAAAEVDAARASRGVGGVVEHRGDPLALDHQRRRERARRVQGAHARRPSGRYGAPPCPAPRSA